MNMDENIGKSTVTGTQNIELFQAFTKDSNGKYIAVLSDDSVDRDGEIVGKEALMKIQNDEGYVSILLNHENKIENLVGEWVNRRLETIDGHTALVAEPKFYLSNEKAKMIKGMLDEGAKCGISIGAMVKNCESRKINNKSVNVYTELELLEASFVAIPSNRHGRAMAVAKMFGKKKQEETQMTEEKTYSEKEYQDLVEKHSAVEEALVKANEKIAELEKEAEAPVEEPVEEKPAEEEAEKSVDNELQKNIDSLKETVEKQAQEIEKLKKRPVYKAEHDTPEGENKVEAQKKVSYPFVVQR